MEGCRQQRHGTSWALISVGAKLEIISFEHHLKSALTKLMDISQMTFWMEDFDDVFIWFAVVVSQFMKIHTSWSLISEGAKMDNLKFWRLLLSELLEAFNALERRMWNSKLMSH
ncbi:hypothetical protein HNY73_010199 [Argiope bruennichi]|uniref:Uncharacterized protein n=1 Tax=Argiope bruennichi TaxID=94029 RepID=A0A8T0F077_ARGBR|nr:hypothetical protein HNY73_010199 [Argiope bruennichi]